MCVADIDSSFPEDKYSLFAITDETAEFRKEALNTFLLSVCGCESLMNKSVCPPLSPPSLILPFSNTSPSVSAVVGVGSVNKVVKQFDSFLK
jgi:hypothetical protein